MLEENEESFYINNGWAFVEGVKSNEIMTFVVLKSDSETRIFNTNVVGRYELAAKYGMEYFYAGFELQLPKHELKKGKYKNRRKN